MLHFISNNYFLTYSDLKPQSIDLATFLGCHKYQCPEVWSVWRTPPKQLLVLAIVDCCNHKIEAL